jgi:hypothetical protein
MSTYLWNDEVDTDAPTSISTFHSTYPTGNYAGNDALFHTVNPFKTTIIARADTWTTAQIGYLEASLQDVMLILKQKFRAWWFIDTSGYFRIENEAYFRNNSPQLNISTLPSYKPETDRKTFNFDKSEIFTQSIYSENNQSDEDFIPFPVVYNIINTSPQTENLNLNLSTDVKFMYNNPNDASNYGFVLMSCNLQSGIYSINFGPTTITPGTYIPNGYFSWSYLFKYFWTYFLNADTATVNNGTAITALGVKEFLHQEDVKFYHNTSLDWRKPVTLSFGTGWLRSWEYTPETGFYSINIGFNPYK